MKNIFKILVVFILFFLQSEIINAQAGTLDTTFGNGGLFVQTTVNGYERSIIQPDGKIVIVGSNIGISFDRFNPDGTYDESFGINGRLNITLNGKLAGPQYKSFALLDDGRIISTALYLPNGYSGKIDVGLVRVNQNGTLDSSFGINGLDTLELDNMTRATGLVVQPDGKIVVSGDVQKHEYDEKRTFLCRFMPDGGLDPTFGEGGVVISTYSQATNSNSLVINSTGKLIRGSTYNKYSEQSAYMLESFNPDGSKDAGFGENGVAKYVFGEGQSGEWFTIMEGASIQTDNKIVCFGESGKNYAQIAICRFNANGSIDQGFGENGSLIVPYKNNIAVLIMGSDVQPDGKILTVGGGGDYPFGALLLVRYLANGQLDLGFGDNGITSIINDTAHIGASSVHYLPDGKILTTGTLVPIGPKAYTVLARFNGDNVLATHFNNVQTVQDKESVTISWQTLNESGTKNYSIERSSNATDFTSIATVPAKGGQENSYSYTDHHPLEGTSYYRIKENALNGTAAYSNTLKIIFESNTISLYPNPAKNTITITGLNKQYNATIRITDMHGRELLNQKTNNSSAVTLSIRALAQGSYFVLIEQNGKMEKLRLVKE